SFHFWLTRKTGLEYDFVTAFLPPNKAGAFPPLRQTAVPLMATVQKNMCVSQPDGGKTGPPGTPASVEGLPTAADLPQAYSELQERFQRTTNALGSAAHDLKTPL